MNCRKIEEMLSAYIDKETNDKENALVEKHMHECAQCGKVYKRLFKTKELLVAMPVIPAPVDFAETVLKNACDRIQPVSVLSLIPLWFAERKKLALGLGLAAALFLGIFAIKNLTLSMEQNIPVKNLFSEHLASTRNDSVCLNSRSVTFLASSNFVLTSHEDAEEPDND